MDQCRPSSGRSRNSAHGCRKFAGVPCVRRGEIYNCDRRTNAAGGNDYWESGVVRPDVVLHDLIAVFHPEALDAADREMHYYRKLE